MTFLYAVVGLASSGCLGIVSSQGGGEADLPIGKRVARPTDVAMHPGYRLEVVATDLTYPSAITFDDKGNAIVVESGYAYGEDFSTARLLRIEADGKKTMVAEGKNVPWTGVHFHEGSFYIAEGGSVEGGRIVKIGADGKRTVLVQNLPSFGDHHTNGPVVGKDGYVYFSQGTVTNSGVVGEDAMDFGWLKRHPDAHDVPCKDITLVGHNFTTKNPLTPAEDDKATTGAFQPFNTPSTPDQVVKGAVPCSGAVMRVKTDGGPVELVAWGFRNPFGLRFSPEGSLWVTDNGYDDRGSRRVFGNADWLWEVKQDTWYGWPDYADGRPLEEGDGDNRYTPARADPLKHLLKEPPNKAPKPAAYFGVHSSATGFDFSRSAAFGFEGQAFVALFGDMAANTGKVLNPVGFKVIRVDPKTGVMYDFAANKGHRSEPASKGKHGGLERPVDVEFNPAAMQCTSPTTEPCSSMMARPRATAAPACCGESCATRVEEVMTKKAAHSALSLSLSMSVAGFLGACTSQQNSPPFAGALPELKTPEEKRGEIVFMQNCNQCHPGGAGGLGPALNNKPAPEPAIMLVVRAGPGEMPRFNEDDLSNEDVKAVAEYVVALRHADNDAEDAAEKRTEAATR